MKLHTETFIGAKFDNDISNIFVDNPDRKFLLLQNLQGWIHSYSSPHFIWTSPWLDWKTLIVKLHTETFIGAKIDNDLSNVFVDIPDQSFLLLQNLLGWIHSYSSPHFIWTIPWLDWKTLIVKLHTETFIGAKIDNDMSNIFVDNPDQKHLLLQNLLECIHFYSSPQSIWTGPCLDWKTLFVKLHTETFIGAKFDNDISNIFVDNPDRKFVVLQNLLGWVHSYSSPHFIWTSPWLDWKTLIVKLHTETFIGAKIDNDMSNIFVDIPDQSFLLLQNLIGWIHSYSSPHFIWTSPWLDWKTLIVKLHTETFIGAKFDNDMSTFLVDNPDQWVLLFQNLLGCIHSYSTPHSIWTSPWLDWKTLIMKLHTETFIGAKIDNDMSNIFVDNPDQKHLLLQNLLECIHFYSSPQSIWTGPCLDWKTLFVKLHTETFIGAKFDNDISNIFVDNPDRKFLLLQNLLGWIHSYYSPHFIWTSPWLDWKTLIVKLHTETFIGAKIDNDMSNIFVDIPDQSFLLLQNLLGWIHSYSSPHFIWTSPWLDWKTLIVKLHTETFLGARKLTTTWVIFP